MMSKGHFFLLGVAIMVLVGCARKPASGAGEYYGSSLKDHEYCMSLTKDVDAVRSGNLSAEDEEKLIRLSQMENPVSNDANGVLGAYAQNNEALKRRLIDSVPGHLESASSFRVYNAVNLIRWFKVEGFDGQLESLLSSLSAKEQPSDSDQVAIEAIRSQLGRQR